MSAASAGAASASRQARMTRPPKPRPDWLWAPLGLLGALLIRCLHATVRLRFAGEEHLRAVAGDGSACILTFWHRNLLLLFYAAPRQRLAVWASQSDAGELIARAMARFGVVAARGSNSRGGLAALQQMARHGRNGLTLAIAPDGPRGPAEVVKTGTLMVAVLTGLPILPIGEAASWSWRAPGWDRLLVPLPGARVQFVYGEPMQVRRGDDLEAAASELQRRLKAAETRARQLLDDRGKEAACAA